MSILEILEDHRQDSKNAKDTRFHCLCGWVSEMPRYGHGQAEHRAHQAQVLAQHEREAKAEAVRESARYLNHIMPNGLVNPIAVLADLDVAADRLSRGLHANGQDRKTP